MRKSLLTYSKMLAILKGKMAILLFLALLANGGALIWHFRIPESRFLWEKLRLEKMALALNPHDADLYFSLGNYYFNGSAYDIAEAKEYFLLALEERPDFYLAHYQLGRIHFINGDFYQALLEIKKTIELSPEYHKAYYMYGLINGYKGSSQEAIYGFSEFIKRDEMHNWAGYNDLAWIYFRLGNFDKTREVCEEGLQYDSYNPWLNNTYGTALLNLNEKDKAREAFERAKEAIGHMSAQDWGRAYPGNNPAIYKQGFQEMKSVIEHNLKLVEK